MVGDWRDVSVLIAGCGSIGKRHARVLRWLGVRDIRASDPLPRQRHSLLDETPGVCLYESYEAGLADAPTAVFVCTPPKLHVPMAIQAVRAGCHVFTEKPLSDSPEGVGELAALAQTHGRKVMVGLCFRYHDGLLTAKRYLDSGRFGRLVSVRALMGEHLPTVRPDYHDLFSSQYLGAYDLMHDIDLALWYAGLPVRSVLSASGSYSDIGIRAPDVAEIVIEFEGGCLASVHLDFFQMPRRRQTELLCTQGVILVEFADWDECSVSTYAATAGEWHHERMATNRDDMFRAEDGEFLQAVAEDMPIRYGIGEGLKSVEVVSECLRQQGLEGA